MKKILIVEDQMLARKYLCSCIEKSTECEVASALTRADAALQRCGAVSYTHLTLPTT